MKATQARTLLRCQQRIQYMETLLALLYSRTSDEWVRDRIRVEFLGSPDDKRVTTEQRLPRPRNGMRRVIEIQQERDAR